MTRMIAILFFVFTSTAFSATRLQFFLGDQNAMTIVTPMDVYGNADNDSTHLYQQMNVPEQDTMLGKGKAIVSQSRAFNLVCGQNKNQCQIILSKSPETKISSLQKKMKFSVKGDKAAALTSLFQLDENNEFHFQATDSLFKIVGTADEFTFEAADQ